MHIFDKKEVTICLCEEECVPSLWTNSRYIVQLAENYFEYYWKNVEILEIPNKA